MGTEGDSSKEEKMSSSFDLQDTNREVEPDNMNDDLSSLHLSDEDEGFGLKETKLQTFMEAPSDGLQTNSSTLKHWNSDATRNLLSVKKNVIKFDPK